MAWWLAILARFNGNSVRSGRREGDDERICAMKPSLRLERFPPPVGLKPGAARSAGQRSTYLATTAPIDVYTVKRNP